MDGVDRSFVALDSPTSRRNPLGYHSCQGTYTVPTGKTPRVAVVAAHYNVDFSEHYLAPLFAHRGYGFLGWNTRFRGNEEYFSLAHALIDIGVGVQWLKEQGVETVVLLGNSGGGSLMAAYQSQAAEPDLRPEPHAGDAPEALRDLTPADLYISLNAHLGRPEVFTAWLDPSVTDENDPVSVDPALDMFDESNGPPYSPDFVRTYRSAQEARNHRITRWALSEIERLEQQQYRDRSFSIHRVWADLRMLDGALDPSDRPVGTCYAGDPRLANYSPYVIGHACTVRSWLSMWSLKTSQCRAAPHLERFEIPALVVQATADTGVFPSDAEAILDHLGSADKELRLVAGAHYFEAPGDDRESVADLLVDWLRSRGARA